MVGSLVALFALYYTFRNVSLQDLADSFLEVKLVYLIPAIWLMALSYLARAYRWGVILSPLKSIKLTWLYFATMAGFLGNVLPLRAGEALRIYLLGKKYNLPYPGVLATVLVEWFFDLIMLFSVILWFMIFHWDLFDTSLVYGSGMNDSMANFSLVSLCLLTFMVATVLILSYKKHVLASFIHWIGQRLPKKWQYNLDQLMQDLHLGFAGLREIHAILKIFVYTLLEWVLSVFSFYPLYWAFELQNRTLESVLILTVVVIIVVTIFPTPAFIGSFHAGVYIALHDIMHEAAVPSVSFGVVAWFLNILVIFGSVFYFLMREHISITELSRAN